jgi:hypothetical protein
MLMRFLRIFVVSLTHPTQAIVFLLYNVLVFVLVLVFLHCSLSSQLYFKLEILALELTGPWH